MEANKFLYQLSTETEGRFHYYNIYLTDPDAAEFIVVSIWKQICLFVSSCYWRNHRTRIIVISYYNTLLKKEG